MINLLRLRSRWWLLWTVLWCCSGIWWRFVFLGWVCLSWRWLRRWIDRECCRWWCTSCLIRWWVLAYFCRLLGLGWVGWCRDCRWGRSTRCLIPSTFLWWRWVCDLDEGRGTFVVGQEDVVDHSGVLVVETVQVLLHHFDIDHRLAWPIIMV